MADVNMIGAQETSTESGRKITSLEFLLPNHAIVMAINKDAKDEYPCPGFFCGAGFISLDKILVNPDGRILEGRPKPQFSHCHGPIVYEGQRQEEDYKLSFFPIRKVEISSQADVDHKPVIDEMVNVMREAYRIK
ncbi:hypothetical protein GOV12_05680 [Candidatus Pacearchaeota archaeon]|nr:hypothetical protein [Candidatus Pacearchaeota archaeon]